MAANKVIQENASDSDDPYQDEFAQEKESENDYDQQQYVSQKF